MKTPRYAPITAAERYTIGVLRRHGCPAATIARVLGRHRSTIGREVRRNATHHDGSYRPQLADWAQVHARLREEWSPEQVAGRFRVAHLFRISHETISRHIWADKRAGGTLHTHLRGARKRFRKRYGYYDSRGRLAGKRPITERPAIVDARGRIGDWEADTILGAASDPHCLLSLVERKTGYLVLGKLAARTTAEVNWRAAPLIQAQPHPVHTITSDNGTEFHGYAALEAQTGARFYFATPHHAWERGTKENTNGLVRQYAPKRQSMAHLTQHDCRAMARTLNERPRKRLGSKLTLNGALYGCPDTCVGDAAAAWSNPRPS